MKYDFDAEVNRRNTGSLKWDIAENELPLWVADMDFKTAPAVQEALKRKVQGGVFGYQIITEDWYEAIINWWDKRHHFRMEKKWLIFCTGVIPAITSAVKRVTNQGDQVVVQTPVYNIFFNSIENAGRHVVENELAYENGNYEIDYEDLEKKLSHPLTTMMILCNPHNPSGKIWTAEELGRIGALCKKYHVTVLSDEIHCELTDPGMEYVPFASVSEECRDNSITCISASKSFNVAGLQSAAVIIPEKSLRDKIERGLNSDEVAEPNSFAVCGAVAAFTEGEEWLDELREYLYQNKEYLRDFVKREIPELKIIDSDATYLLWIDCTGLGDAEEFQKFLREKTGLYLTAGGQYRGNGRDFLRLNAACQRNKIEDACERLKTGVKLYVANQK